jgi:hypothetical protein
MVVRCSGLHLRMPPVADDSVPRRDLFRRAPSLERVQSTLVARETIRNECDVNETCNHCTRRQRGNSYVLGLTRASIRAAPREEVEAGVTPAFAYEPFPVATLQPLLLDRRLQVQRGETHELWEQSGSQTHWDFCRAFADATKIGNLYSTLQILPGGQLQGIAWPLGLDQCRQTTTTLRSEP